MNCPSCGLELAAAQLVCPRCGHALEFGPDQPGADANPADSPWARPDAEWEWGAAPDENADAESTVPVPDGVEPTLAFGSPQQYLTGSAEPPAGPHAQAWAGQPGGPEGFAPPPDGRPVPPATSRRRLLPVLLLVVALVLAGGGLAAAALRFGWLGGGGPRPAEVMPGNTLAYVQLDLDPSLAQKAQAWQFLRDLPEVKAAMASGQPDPRRLLWDAVAKGGDLGDDDFDTDVKPWLGNRVGFGVIEHGDRQTWLTAVQVTDEAKAAAKLREWIATSRQDYDVTTRDGFALITMTPDTGYVLGELDKGSLSADERFRSDLDLLGDPGVLAGWADLAALTDRVRGPDSGADLVKGRAAFALRFSANTLSFDGRLIGVDESLRTGITGGGELDRLPASTGVAAGVSGGAKSLEAAWPQFGDDADSWLHRYGLEKADVDALLGRQFAISVPASALGEWFAGEPEVGLRIVSDDAERARTALHTLAGQLNGELATTLVDHIDGDVLTVATSGGYLAELRDGSARLGTSDSFTGALPNHARATSGVFVDLAATRLTDAAAEMGEYRDFVSALRSVGSEYVDEGPGAGTWSVRVVRS
nr:DUF3352 domain-containing protein [Propionicimonas sp.]